MRFLVPIALVLVACGPVVSDDDPGDDSSTTGRPSTTSASTTNQGTATTEPGTSSTSTGTTEPTTVGTSVGTTVGTTVDPDDSGDVTTNDTSFLDIGGVGGCGDGEIDVGEQCDGDNLQGFDCVSLGLPEGELTCSEICTFDTSDCIHTDCGNGVIDPGEQCDGMDLQGFDCESLGLAPGTLACDPVMCTFDTSMCTGE